MTKERIEKESLMTHLEIITHGDNCWPDLATRPFNVGRLAAICRLPRGMVSGKPSVTVRIELQDGLVVLAETSLALLRSALVAFESATQNDEVVGSTRALPALADYAGLAKLSPVDLLAWLVWGEAEGETHGVADDELPKGQLAVAHTVLNRVKKARWWGRDVHGVILYPGQYDGLRRIPTPAGPPPPALRTLAQLVLAGHTVDPTPGATHFLPLWKEKPWDLPEVARIGNHKFFRED